MSVLKRIAKPTTRKGKKVLIRREPQIIEGPKKSLFIRGRKTSEKIRVLVNDFYNLKKPNAMKLNRSNDITVFEDVTPVERYCKKYESPLFVLGSHSKKRPDNLVIGRMFDYNLLDMVELSVDEFEPMNSFTEGTLTLGTKPSLIFNGPAWEQSDELKQLKSMFVDFFHREHVDTIRLQGLEHAISFTISKDGKILFRSYKVLLKKSGCKTPRVELQEIGPRIGFSIRRSKLPTEDLMKQACRKPKELKVTKKKNISKDGLGTTHGRVHLGKQDVNRLQTRKMKGLRKSVTEQKAEKTERKLRKSKSIGEENQNMKRIKVA